MAYSLNNNTLNYENMYFCITGYFSFSPNTCNHNHGEGLTVVQKMIINTLHIEGKPQQVFAEKTAEYAECCIEAYD